MGILAPLALIALPLLGIILALYLLKLRRPVAPVGSLHLWESLTRDREANSLWQKLRVSLLLLLQLLVLLVLILALARPWVATNEPVGQHAIIIVDVSASMASEDADENGRQSRIEAAQAKARDIIDSLPQDGMGTLISSDKHASVVVPATGDRARLREAIGRLSPQSSGTDMAEAVKLAGVMAARQPNSSVWLLSDGAFPSVAESVGAWSTALHFVGFGHSTANQALTALSLQQHAGNLQLFAQLVNSDSKQVTRRLDLTVDDAPWTARTLTLAPGATQELVLDDVPLDARVVRAELSGLDELGLDDKAWVVNRASATANVLLVTSGDKFLELALSLLPTINLYKVGPTDYKPSETINGAPVDLTIFDAGTPAEILAQLPAGNLLLVAPESANALVQVTGVITEPVPASSPLEDFSSTVVAGSASGRDPLLRFVDVSAINISKAVRLEDPQWGRTVLSSDKGPLILAGEVGNRKAAVLAFDLHDSDLPLQTGFPLLMRNVISYLLPEPAGGLPSQVLPGAPVGIDAFSPDVDRITVEDPSAKMWSYAIVPASQRVAFPETGLLGVYYVSQYSGEQLVGQEAFAVNMFERAESMTGPNAAPGLPIGNLQTGESVKAEFKYELWPIVALVGILLLLLEWFYAQRIAIRRAWTEWQSRRSLSKAGRP